jgi:hypothetical protein
MPCRDDFGEAEAARQQIDRLHLATRVACSACGLLEQIGKLAHLPVESQNWWDKHKRADEARRRREEEEKRQEDRRREIIARLTPEERKLLGVKI